MAHGLLEATGAYDRFTHGRRHFRSPVVTRRLARLGLLAPLLTAIAGARASGYPRIAFDRNEVVFAWTENQAGQSVVKTAAAQLPAAAGSAQ